MRKNVLDSTGNSDSSKKEKGNHFISNRKEPSVEQIEKEQADLEKYLASFLSEETSFSKKMNCILQMNAIIIPKLLWELNNPVPDVDRTMIASRTISSIKELGNTLMKSREIELSDDINLNSPKFQAVLGWFMDLFNEILERHDINNMKKNEIFNDLSIELSGWEDRIMKKLKGASSKALKGIKNPFLEKIKK